MLHCRYKAWQLSRSKDEVINLHQGDCIPSEKFLNTHSTSLTIDDKLILTALYISEAANKDTLPNTTELLRLNTDGQKTTVRIRPQAKKAQQLLSDYHNVIDNNEPPAFYRNSHCSECQFWTTCYEKLKQRDCISLLSGMPPKVILSFHKKAIYSIK